jgi:hypothetical protein
MACRNYDADGFERRRTVMGEAECPKCGKPVPLEADTDCWRQGDGGRWDHAGYGPACGVCCGLLVVDSWDGCDVYDLTSEGEQCE